jgi:hypothetical protein
MVGLTNLPSLTVKIYSPAATLSKEKWNIFFKPPHLYPHTESFGVAGLL